MGRPNRKRKPFNPAAGMTQPAETIHDRRAREDELVRNADVAVMEVEDPMGLEPGDKITVLRSLRADPLAQLHARGHIDNAQYQGGRAFQNDWEKAERGPGAVDPAKEYVDGGLPADPISVAQIAALDRLTKAEAKLGAKGISLTQDVLIHGRTMSEVAYWRGLQGKGWEEYFGKRFRECLETLAEAYGFVSIANK